MTEERFIEAQENNEGYCKNCLEWTHDSCEPDARYYRCPQCDKLTVFGADEAFLMGLIEFTDEAGEE